MTTATTLNEPARGSPTRGQLPIAVYPLVAVLKQLEDLLGAMTDGQYQTRPAGMASNVGGHLRHCLDHIDALLTAVERGSLDYDQRRRGTAVESSRDAALAVIRRQKRELLAFPTDSEGWPLRLSAIVSSALPAIEVGTSVGRELAFVLSHTIHHNALIGVMAQALGVSVPERFGYAPSTIAHLEKTSCVQ